MNRTLRSKKLRSVLWYHADGKCQICGAALDPANWHADHKVPWSVKAETNVHDMQATCPKCNQQKGAAIG